MKKSEMKKLEWSLYILRCADGSLYTGIAKNVAARLSVHQNGKGAAYTRSRRPLTLVYQEKKRTQRQALKRECAIKKLKKSAKEKLILLSCARSPETKITF